MHANDRRAPWPRRHRPLVESLEARDLPSSIVLKSAAASLEHRPHAVAVQSLAHPAASRSLSGPARNTAHTDSPNGLLGNNRRARSSTRRSSRNTRTCFTGQTRRRR